MHFHAARLQRRVDRHGDLVPFSDQDRSRWDATLIAQGRRELRLSAAGNELTAYHVEAAIAEPHADAPSVDRTDWQAIVALYETLIGIQPSPVVALNRAVAIAQRDGPARGFEEIERIDDRRPYLPLPFTCLSYHATYRCSRSRA